MKSLFPSLSAALFVACSACASAGVAAQTLLTNNFSADPSPHFFAGQYVVYATDDQNNSEAPFLHERNGVYYFSFSTGWPGQIVYATGASPKGPFVYRGVLLDFLPISTNHHAILERDGKSLLFYHDKVLPGGGDHRRSIVLTELAYGADGAMTAPAPKPLFRDPVFDGAADPSIIYDAAEKKWLMFYTNRRANVPGLGATTWVHGTPIGVAESADGKQWRYRGTVDFPKDIPNTSGTPTYWAPAVVKHDDVYHMYLTIVPGIFEDWQHPRAIVHLSSRDLKTWQYESTLKLASDRVIDAGVVRLRDGSWRMWYNNEPTGKSMYYADSADLYHWTDKGAARLPQDRGEAPLPFFWKGKYWLLTDLLGNAGLGAYRSDDASHWQRQPHSLLDQPGRGIDDNNGGHHPEVVISEDRAYLFYFVHPGVPDNKRSVIQVVELKLVDGWLQADRDAPTYISLTPPAP